MNKKKICSKLIEVLAAIWFWVAVLLSTSTGQNEEFTWANVAGLVIFAGFAWFANMADRKGWIEFKEGDDIA